MSKFTKVQRRASMAELFDRAMLAPTRGFASQPVISPVSKSVPQSSEQSHQTSPPHYDFSQISIQPKLTISQPNDPYEQEADRVADQVMEMQEPRTSERQLVMRSLGETIHRKCSACEQEEEEVQAKLVDTPVQTKPILQRSSNGSLQAGGNLGSRLSSSKGGGSPLPDDVRSFMEPRFGHDFSQVRVHTDSAAIQMNQDLSAQAFTHKQDIYFGAKKAPAKDALTAHELTHVVQQTSGTEQTIQCKKENEDALASIQGHAMFNLLPRLLDLSEEVRSDEEAGNFVGGTRLVTAMRAVKARGKSWLEFAAAHNGELAALPVDQIADIMNFLGAPKDARYFKADQFEGRFDGAVDPSEGSITLFFRIKFEVIGARFGGALPGTPKWQEETKAGFEQFKSDFKRVVEEAWSNKGTVQPACPIPGLKAFQTKVVVTVVDRDEHKLVHILSDTPGGRSNMSKDATESGNLQVSDNKPKEGTRQVVDPTGRHPEIITTSHTTSAHEFGHAIGLDHSRCPGSEDNCYGVTAEERRDIMGGGDKVQVIKRKGKILHDDFTPFERIGERWGRDIFPGALVGKCNKWSAQ